jgi:hypothetical protein
MSDTTDVDGHYAFTQIVPGKTYAVCEVLELSFYQSFPTNLTLYPDGEAMFDCSVLGANYGPYGYQFAAKSGDEYLDNNFGNYQEVGCTLTQGYWKNHDWDSNHFDPTWDKIGEDTSFFDTGIYWNDILDIPPKKGNAYFILAHQYIAAVLNSMKDDNPASTGIIADEMAQAAALLDYYDTMLNEDGMPNIPAGGTEFSGDDRALAISLAETLDLFNNGELPGGPPHCDE